MYSILAFLLVVAFVAFEIRSGVAVLGFDHSVKRSKAAGPFWMIIAIQLFAGIVVTVVAAAIEFGIR